MYYFKRRLVSKLDEKQNIKLPIAHGEGRYHCDQDTLKRLIDNDLIALNTKLILMVQLLILQV